MTDELRGAALATIDCTAARRRDDDDGFDPTQLVSGTPIYCNAVTTVIPTAVDWTVLEGSGIDDRSRPRPGPRHGRLESDRRASR